MKATSRTFSKLVQAASRRPSFIDSRGGTRSGKTYAALQLLIILAETDPIPRITSVVSRALPHLKQGAIRDFKQILTDSGKWNENAWNASGSSTGHALGNSKHNAKHSGEQNLRDSRKFNGSAM